MKFQSLHSGLKVLKNVKKSWNIIKITALCSVHLAINEKTVFVLEDFPSMLYIIKGRKMEPQTSAVPIPEH